MFIILMTPTVSFTVASARVLRNRNPSPGHSRQVTVWGQWVANAHGDDMALGDDDDGVSLEMSMDTATTSAGGSAVSLAERLDKGASLRSQATTNYSIHPPRRSWMWDFYLVTII